MTQLQSTSSPPTCEPQPSEPCATIDAICPEHGAYRAKIVPPAWEGMKPIKAGCPTCADERRAAEAARKERDAQREREQRVYDLRARAGIPARFADRHFADYTAAAQGQRIVLGVCRAFADSWPDKRQSGASLVLTGSPGTGKTHLACAVANAVIESHLASVLFATVAGALRYVKDSYRKDSERTERDALRQLTSPDLLILDEVGVQLGSEHEKLLMFEILNTRYQDLLPTILISNLSGAELEAFLGQRVMDRYRECGSVLAFDWESYRGRA